MQGERNPITVVIIFIWNRATVCWPEEVGACLPICCGRCVSRCATALMSIVPLWKIRLSRSISQVVGESHLKTVPKGFPKDFPYPQYIRCKDFTVACRVEDEFFSRPDFMERIIDVFRQLKRFADFTNETIDEFE